MMLGLTCLAERESSGFAPADRLAFALRLAVEAGADDANLVEGGLAALPSLAFALYELVGETWRCIGDPVAMVAPAAIDVRPLTDWLARRAVAGFYGMDPAMAGGDELLDPGALHAHEAILAIASQTAPVPQTLGLAGIVSWPEGAVAAEATALMVWPLPAGVAAPGEFVAAPGPLDRVEHDFTAGGGLPFDLVRGHALPVEAAPVPALFDRLSGFFKASPYRADALALLDRFERQAGSQLNPAAMLRGAVWHDAGSPWPAALTLGTVLNRLSWQAVMAVAATLDPVLLALQMPGRLPREGALVAGFAKLLCAELAPLRAVKSGAGAWRQRLVAELRRAIAALPLLQRPADAAGRLALAQALAERLDGAATALPLLRLFLDAYHQGPSADILARIAAVLGEDVQPLDPLKPAGDRAERLATALAPEIAELDPILASEAGCEALIVALLRAAAPRLTATLAAGGELGVEEVIAPRVAAAIDALAADFAAGGNGAQQVRMAVGPLFADLLELGLGGRAMIDVDVCRDEVDQWDYWQRRLLGGGLAPPPDPVPPAPAPAPSPAEVARDQAVQALLGALVMPVPDPAAYLDDPDGATRRIAVVAEAAETLALDLLFRRGARFLPDTVPPAVCLRLTLDDHEDGGRSVGEFAAAYAGVALLLRGTAGTMADPWAYANLVDIWWEPPGRPGPDLVDAMIALPASESDGRLELKPDYDGRPFGMTLFHQADDPRRLFRWAYPQAVKTGGVVPAIGYGSRIEVASFAIGRAGSLPVSLQRGLPWRPVAAPQPPGPDFITDFPISRTTAIGAVEILDRGRPRIGQIPERVQPLALDYPRLSLSALTGEHLDLLRDRDGFGLIASPARGASVTVELHDLVCWQGNHVLDLTVSGTATLAVDAAGGAPSLHIPLADKAVHRLELVLRVDANGDLFVLGRVDGVAVAGGERPLGPCPPDRLWLRARLEGAGSLSLAHPGADRPGAALRPDPLLLVGADTAWTAPFDEPAQAAIVTPRVSAKDFLRAAECPAIFERLFAGDTALGEDFVALLQVGDLDRGEGRAHAPWIDRLPDPMVETLLVQLDPLDSLSGPLPQRDDAVTLLPQARPCPLPALPAVLARLRAPIAGGDLATVLETLDKTYRIAVTIDAGPAALSIDGGATPRVAVRQPAGETQRLRVRPLVAAALFDAAAHPAPIIDPRMLQLAEGIQGASAGRHYVFPGASLTIEAMVVLGAAPGDADWPALAAALIDHRADGTSRSYQLQTADAGRRAALPTALAARLWRWRRLGWVETGTQRWRFMGVPIYHWADPHRLAGPAALAVARGQASFEIALSQGGDDADRWLAFEEDAFAGRDPADYESEMAALEPGGHSTTLARIGWEEPSATIFRHRFRLWSRYQGACARSVDASVSGMPARIEDDGEAWAWRRCVILADARGLQLSRPQLRAVVPLTRAPSPDGLTAPPLLAMLQEQALLHGGLAERVSARIANALHYAPGTDISDAQGDAVQLAEIGSEIGPSQGHAPVRLAPAELRGLTIEPHGPIGLTYDPTDAQAPAYPNSAYLLPLTRLDAGAAHRPASVDFENHLVEIVLQRWLDPNWVIREPLGRQFDRSRPAWVEFDVQADVPAVGVIAVGDGATHWREILRWDQNGEGIVATVAKAMLDPSLASSTAMLELTRIPKGKTTDQLRLGVLIVPLDAARFSVGLFASPRDVPPVLIRAIIMTPPSPAEERLVRIAGADGAVATAASQETAPTWSKIARNFDTVHVLAPGQKETEPVGALALRASIATEDGSRRVRLHHERDPATLLWPRGRQKLPRSPGAFQSHQAVMISELVPGRGVPIERPRAVQLVTGRETNLTDAAARAKADFVRLIEFETPATVIGTIPGQDDLLGAHLKRARFDLVAIGAERIAATLTHLSFCLRLIGNAADRAQLTMISLRLESDAGGGPIISEPIDLAIGGTGTAVEDILLDIAVDSEGRLAAIRHGWIDARGALSKPINHLAAPTVEKAGEAPKGEAAIGGGGLLLPAVSLVLAAPPVFADDQDHELWLEIAMLAASPSGFIGPLDFDWFFGRGETPFEAGMTQAALRTMAEAQAELVRFSPAIAVVDES